MAQDVLKEFSPQLINGIGADIKSSSKKYQTFLDSYLNQLQSREAEDIILAQIEAVYSAYDPSLIENYEFIPEEKLEELISVVKDVRDRSLKLKDALKAKGVAADEFDLENKKIILISAKKEASLKGFVYPSPQIIESYKGSLTDEQIKLVKKKIEEVLIEFNGKKLNKKEYIEKVISETISRSKINDPKLKIMLGKCVKEPKSTEYKIEEKMSNELSQILTKGVDEFISILKERINDSIKLPIMDSLTNSFKKGVFRKSIIDKLVDDPVRFEKKLEEFSSIFAIPSRDMINMLSEKEGKGMRIGLLKFIELNDEVKIDKKVFKKIVEVEPLKLSTSPQVIDLALKMAEAPQAWEYVIQAYCGDSKVNTNDFVKGLLSNSKELSSFSEYYEKIQPILSDKYESALKYANGKDIPYKKDFLIMEMENGAALVAKLIGKDRYDNLEMAEKVIKDKDAERKLTALESKLLDKRHGINSTGKFYKHLGGYPKARDLFDKMFSHDATAIEAAMDRLKSVKIEILPEKWQEVGRLIALEEKMISANKESREIINTLLIKKGKCDLSALSACELAVENIDKFKDVVAKAEWKSRSEGILPALTKLFFKRESEEEFIENFKTNFSAKFKRASYFDNADFIEGLRNEQAMLETFELGQKEKELKQKEMQMEQESHATSSMSLDAQVPEGISSKLDGKPPRASYREGPSKPLPSPPGQSIS
jgi:hypothetical protein